MNVQGWGENVFTVGYGDYAYLAGDTRQKYTHTFGGTSSASPFVAGPAAAIQSLAAVRLGRRLTPAEMRQLLIDTGIPQGSGGHIGPFPDMGAAILELSVACDCNQNAVPDLCDIANGTSDDTNGNGIPDECDIAAGTSDDCNGNEIPDECDISSGTSNDCNGNGVPDECESLGPNGACCMGDGTCQVLQQQCCTGFGRLFLAGSRTCDPGNGSCCLGADGCCVDSTQTWCSQQGGSWRASETCATRFCPTQRGPQQGFHAVGTS